MWLLQQLPIDILKSIILLLPLIWLCCLFFIKSPTHSERAGMLLAVLYNIPFVVLLNIVAIELGYWQYSPSDNSFYTIPIEIIFGWAFFWGALLPYALKKYSIVFIFMLELMLDVIFMPQMTQLITLSQYWLLGELLLLTACLLPGLFIYRLTVKRKLVFLSAIIQ